MRSESTRPTKRDSLLWLAAGLFFFLQGCSPAWTVVRESGPPSVLRGATSVGVSFDYSQFAVEGMPEQNWVEKKSADEEEYASKTWPELKASLESNFMDGFRSKWAAVRLLPEGAEPADGTVVATVQVLSLDMGKLIPFATRPSVVGTAILWTAGAEGEEEIQVSVSENPTLISVSVFQHVRSIGKQIGAIAAKFLHTKK